MAGAQGAHRIQPGFLTVNAGQSVNRAPRVDRWRIPPALPAPALTRAFFRSAPVNTAGQKEVANLQRAKITLGPSLEVFAKAPGQARYGILR